MKEKIKEILTESQFTYAAMRILLQNCLAKDRKPYIAKCFGVDCRECPFYGSGGLCYTPLSHKDWKDIAIEVIDHAY